MFAIDVNTRLLKGAEDETICNRKLYSQNGHPPRFFTIFNSTTNRCPGMLTKKWNGISRRKRPTTKHPCAVTASWRRTPLLHARGSFRCRNCLAEAIALTSFAPESDLCKNAQAFVGCEPVLNRDWLYGTASRSWYKLYQESYIMGTTTSWYAESSVQNGNHIMKNGCILGTSTAPMLQTKGNWHRDVEPLSWVERGHSDPFGPAICYTKRSLNCYRRSFHQRRNRIVYFQTITGNNMGSDQMAFKIQCFRWQNFSGHPPRCGSSFSECLRMCITACNLIL